MSYAPKFTDPRGGHVRLYWEMLDKPAWNSLTATDQRVYVALLRGLRGTNNGDLCLTATLAKHYGIGSKTTLAKSLRALVAVGLIVVTRKGGCARGGQRLPTLYAVTSEPVYEMPKKFIEARKATNDWKQISSIAQGRARIRAAENKPRGSQEILETRDQEMTRTRSKNKPIRQNTGSEIESRAKLQGQSMGQENTAIILKFPMPTRS